MKNTKMKKGFTLVELLFVMAIISILAGIGISQMSGSTDAALKVSAKSDLRTLINSYNLYYAENGERASDISDLDFTKRDGVIYNLDRGNTSDFCISVYDPQLDSSSGWAKIGYDHGEIYEGLQCGGTSTTGGSSDSSSDEGGMSII